MSVIKPNDANYPEYLVEFSAADVTIVPNPIPVTGPHTFFLLHPSGAKFQVSLTRRDAEAGRPNLSVTFTTVD